MLNRNKIKSWVYNTLILGSFAFLSIMSFLFLLRTNYVFGGWDIHFHVSSAFELYQSMKHGVIFPQSDFNYFHGALTMVMYPYLNLYPLMGFFYLFKSYRIAIYGWFILNVFLALVVSFYSSYLTYHSREVSYLFAVLYGMSGFLFSIYTNYMDWGFASAYIFLPLVLFGYINFLKNQNRWLELSTGMSLLIFSHVLSTLIVLGLLLILSLLNVKHFIRYKIQNVLKPIVLTVCVTSVYWVPLIYLGILNHGNIKSPTPSVLNGYNSQYVLSTFKLHPQLGIDILAWFTIVLALFYYRHFDRIIKQLYVIACLILIACSDLIPWPEISRYLPKLEIIQKVYRFYFIPQIILLLILALIVTKYIRWRKVIFLTLIIFTLGVQIQDQIQFVNSRKNEPVLNNNYISHHRYNLFSVPQSFKLNNNHSFRLLGSWLNSKDDYFPAGLRPNSFKNIHGSLVENDGQTTSLKPVDFDHFRFNLNKAGRNVQLPMMIFNGQQVQVLINGHRCPSYVYHNQISVRNLPAGKYDMRISMKKNLGLTWIIIALSIIGLLIYLKEWFIRTMKFRDKGIIK